MKVNWKLWEKGYKNLEFVDILSEEVEVSDSLKIVWMK